MLVGAPVIVIPLENDYFAFFYGFGSKGSGSDTMHAHFLSVHLICFRWIHPARRQRQQLQHSGKRILEHQLNRGRINNFYALYSGFWFFAILAQFVIFACTLYTIEKNVTENIV